jgi:hypothetical protein
MLPVLQFQDVAFGIGYINDLQPTGSGDIKSDKLADIFSAPTKNLRPLVGDVRDFKCDMCKSRFVQGLGVFRADGFVLENLDGRAGADGGHVPGQRTCR